MNFIECVSQSFRFLFTIQHDANINFLLFIYETIREALGGEKYVGC